MAGLDWFYVRENKRVGPVPLQQMREKIARGELRREDLVWKVGMNQWTPAGEVPALFESAGTPSSATPASHPPHAPTAAGPRPAEAGRAERPGELEIAQQRRGLLPQAADPEPAPAPAHEPALEPQHAAPISYYGGGQMPPRAADALRGHAPPTGDTGDWPLDDQRVAQFVEAVKVRKKVTAAAQLYRALMFLYLLGAVMFVLVMLMGAPPGLAGVVGWAMVALFAGLTALCYVTFRATMRAQRWAPLTMFIIFLLALVSNIASIALNLGPRGDMGAVVGGLIAVALTGLFAMISIQSFLAIPAYRKQPAWCQELIVRAGL